MRDSHHTTKLTKHSREWARGLSKILSGTFTAKRQAKNITNVIQTEQAKHSYGNFRLRKHDILK